MSESKVTSGKYNLGGSAVELRVKVGGALASTSSVDLRVKVFGPLGGHKQGDKEHPEAADVEVKAGLVEVVSRRQQR